MPTKSPIVLDKQNKILLDRLNSISAALWAEKNPEVPSKDVNFDDYDGTLVHSYTRAEFLALEALPGSPAHEGLTPQGWNWTLADAQEYVTAYKYLDIGQTYITDDGKTRLYFDISETERLTVKIRFTQDTSEGVSVNWGDGSAAETSESTGAIELEHTFPAAGKYIATLTVAEGCEVMLGTSTATTPNGGDTQVGQYHRNSFVAGAYLGGRDPLVALEIGSGVTSLGCAALLFSTNLETVTIPYGVEIGYAVAFEGCFQLKAVVLPKGFTTLHDFAFRCCYSLKAVSLPASLETLGMGTFKTCVTLKRITIPSSVTQIKRNTFENCFSAFVIGIPDSVQSFGTEAFRNCYTVRALRVPEGITELPNYCFHHCHNLTEITLPSTLETIGVMCFGSVFGIRSLTIPASVTRIKEFAFLFCDGNEEIHILATTPPTLDSATAFSSVNIDLSVYVPWSEDHSVLAAYLEATNWCGIDYLTEEPEPEVTEEETEETTEETTEEDPPAEDPSNTTPA